MRQNLFPCLLLASSLAFAQPPQLVRSIVGPLGVLEGDTYTIPQPRSKFTYPTDRQVVIYFEWDAPPAKYQLAGVWKRPDGKLASISDIAMETHTRKLQAYWTFDLSAGMPGGVWQLDVRINGLPAASQAFEVAVPAPAAPPPPPPVAPPPPSPLTLDQIYRFAPSIVWVYKLDSTGRRFDTASGFVSANGEITTAFQSIDGAANVEIAFADGQRRPITGVRVHSRLQDWAVLTVDTGSAPPLKPAPPTYAVPIGERMVHFSVENDARAIAGIDVVGRTQSPAFGDRWPLQPPTSPAAVGGPLLNPFGEVIGIIGGSTTPGVRALDRANGLSSWFLHSKSGVAATPLPARPPASAAALPLADLHAANALTPYYQPDPDITSGGIVREVAKDPNRQPVVQEGLEISSKESSFAVFANWNPRIKIRQAAIQVALYDAANVRRATGETKRANMPAGSIGRTIVTFAPTQLLPGPYRADILLAGRVVWRGFFSIAP
jgi:S1-C subfamily serine protease